VGDEAREGPMVEEWTGMEVVEGAVEVELRGKDGEEREMGGIFEKKRREQIRGGGHGREKSFFDLISE